MAHRVCPWWLGYFLVSPWRKLLHSPRRILAPFVEEGMTVLEPGCGMGFFTLELARLVGPHGKVIAVDLQARMLDGLRKRARKAGLLDRIETRQATSDSLGLADLAGKSDFVLAFGVVHEVPSPGQFFAEVRQALRPSRKLLLAEPRSQVGEDEFLASVAAAEQAGLRVVSWPQICQSRAVLLTLP